MCKGSQEAIKLYVHKMDKKCLAYFKLIWKFKMLCYCKCVILGEWTDIEKSQCSLLRVHHPVSLTETVMSILMLHTLIHAYLRTATSPSRQLPFQATEHRQNCSDHTEGYFICEHSSGSLMKMINKEGLEAHNMRD